MALEELLRQHERKEESASPDPGSETRDGGSLIRQAAEMIGQAGAEELAPPVQAGAAEGIVCCADGYVRCSPVQAYQTAEDFHRRRVRRIVGIVLGVCVLLLLALALSRSGLLKLR